MVSSPRGDEKNAIRTTPVLRMGLLVFSFVLVAREAFRSCIASEEDDHHAPFHPMVIVYFVCPSTTQCAWACDLSGDFLLGPYNCALHAGISIGLISTFNVHVSPCSPPFFRVHQSRLLVQDCAAKLEAFGLQGAIQEVSMIKVFMCFAAPLACVHTASLVSLYQQVGRWRSCDKKVLARTRYITFSSSCISSALTRF